MLISYSDFFSAKPLLWHHALWLVSFMAGFRLSGSVIRVFLFRNMGLGMGRLEYRSVMGEGGGMDVEWNRGGGVCCLLDVPEGCSCQVNILQSIFEGVKVVGDKCT